MVGVELIKGTAEQLDRQPVSGRLSNTTITHESSSDEEEATREDHTLSLHDDDDDDVDVDVEGQHKNHQNTDQEQDETSIIDMQLVSQLRNQLEKLAQEEPELFSGPHMDELLNGESACTCWRYIEHCAKRPNEALKLIRQALNWRRQNQIDELTNADLIKEIWHLAPFSFSGKTKDGLDVLYVMGKNYRKPDASIKRLVQRFSLSVIFGWDRQHQNDLNKFCIVFDTTDTGYRNIDLDYMSWLVGIRDLIPARIAQIHVVGIPLLVRPLIRLVISWLPEQFSRIVQCGSYEQLVAANIEVDQLPVEAGGSADEARYRLAPSDAPWAADSADYADPAIMRAIEDCIGFSVDEARRERLRNLQLEHEQKQHH